MPNHTTTRERILEASLKLFNEKGYAATPVSEIAKAAGIATGNLTYHFATKRELAEALEKKTRRRHREYRSSLETGAIANDYVEVLRFSMIMSWENRFLLRDHAQFRGDKQARLPDRDMVEDVHMLEDFLKRMRKEGMLRKDLQVELKVLARSLFVLTRFWMDHLREIEGLEQVSWEDQERGLQHHFAVLSPCLTAAARREFESALIRLASRQAIQDDEERNYNER
jgi:AcrR family transcriptional regulator